MTQSQKVKMVAIILQSKFPDLTPKDAINIAAEIVEATNE